MKKIFLSLLAAFAGAIPAHADNTDGFLLITISKYIYENGSRTANNRQIEQVQKYKIVVNSEFLSQFNRKPSKETMGSSFYCGMEDDLSLINGMHYTQWFALKADGRVSTWFWGSGSEVIDGKRINVNNGISSVDIKFPSWQTLDTSDTFSFTKQTDISVKGINFNVAVKYVPANDPALADALWAPFNRADGTALAVGDSQDGLALTTRCAFQY